MATSFTVLADTSSNATYQPVAADQISSVAVFPPLGISRVGNSTTECFLAPEVPNHTSIPDDLMGRFRDDDQNLRRLAVRFRVYAYDGAGKLLGEINEKNGYKLTWKVDVANSKPAGVKFQRNGRFGPHDPSPRNPKVHDRSRLIAAASGTIEGGQSNDGRVTLQGQFQGTAAAPVPVELGHLQVDNAGRLIFIPGPGETWSVSNPAVPHPRIVSGFDSEDWIDEICDGTVAVSVTGSDGADIPNLHTNIQAHVLSAPPKFSWGVHNHTNLYNIMEQMYRPSTDSPAQYDFWRDLWPVLHAAASMGWVNPLATKGHGPSNKYHFSAEDLFNRFNGPTDDAGKRKRTAFKKILFDHLRVPLVEGDPDATREYANSQYMPVLSGDMGDMPGDDTGDADPRKFANVTQLQYDRFQAWRNDADFHLTEPLPIPKDKLEDVELSRQTDELSRAALEWTIGDPLYPGIETYWIAKLHETYNLTPRGQLEINPPFRIADTIKPGGLTQGLSLPWQSDFEMCNTHWWPPARPDVAVTSAAFLDAVQGSHNKDDFFKAIKKPAIWTRGFVAEGSGPGFPRSNDMVEFWTSLGIVRENRHAFTDEAGTEYTALLEAERKPIRNVPI